MMLLFLYYCTRHKTEVNQTQKEPQNPNEDKNITKNNRAIAEEQSTQQRIEHTEQPHPIHTRDRPHHASKHRRSQSSRQSTFLFTIMLFLLLLSQLGTQGTTEFSTEVFSNFCHKKKM